MPDAVFSTFLPSGLAAGDVEALRSLLSSTLGYYDRRAAEPIIAPAMLLGAPGLAEMSKCMEPPVGMGIVHESQMFRRSWVVPVDTSLEISGSMTEVGDARRFDFSLTANGVPMGDMQTRLRFVTPEIVQSLKGGHFRPAMNTDETQWVETAPITGGIVGAYLELSRDPNPIHRDDKAAQAVGLMGAVVPGMLIAGLCDTAITSLKHEVVEMRTRFLAPLAVGETVRLGVQVKSDRLKSRARVFVVADSDRIHAISDFTLTAAS